MATQPKPTQSMAQFVDMLLMQGITWENLFARAAAEAKKKGTATLSQPGQIKAHVKFRSKQAKWKVETNDSGVRMNAVAQPKADKPAKAKPAAKKTGKATGRKTRAVVKEQRQTVEPVVAEPEKVEAA
jgi:hypothetical protein